MKKILIIGGGFAGISCALELLQSGSSDLDITLVSDKSHFEYHAYLYRVVTGRTPLEVCIPLSEIFKSALKNRKANKAKLALVVDTVTEIDPDNKVVHGLFGSKYNYDILVLAVGSQTDYFGIEGLKNYSFGFKTINEALKLKRHIHEMFTKCALAKNHEERKRCMTQIVVVGAGPSGVELAGELASYTKNLAIHHGVDKSLVSVAIVESSSRVLPMLPESVSQIVTSRLKNIGVKVMLNKKIIKEDIETLYLNDDKVYSRTIIWTAGNKINDLYKTIKGLDLNKKGQVVVDDYLNPPDQLDLYIAGDAAQTKYSGMAQTAVYDGQFIAKNILYRLKNAPPKIYVPRLPFYIMPVGTNWAIYANDLIFAGYFGWLLRRVVDFMFFVSILPFKKAMLAFGFNSKVCEPCPVCSD